MNPYESSSVLQTKSDSVILTFNIGKMHDSSANESETLPKRLSSVLNHPLYDEQSFENDWHRQSTEL